MRARAPVGARALNDGRPGRAHALNNARRALALLDAWPARARTLHDARPVRASALHDARTVRSLSLILCGMCYAMLATAEALVRELGLENSTGVQLHCGEHTLCK